MLDQLIYQLVLPKERRIIHVMELAHESLLGELGDGKNQVIIRMAKDVRRYSKTL